MKKPALSVYDSIIKARTEKQSLLAVLVDPGKTSISELSHLINLSLSSPVDFFFVGGSLANLDKFNQCIQLLKDLQPAPVVIFPGNELQIHPGADALLLLSLISGRNPELLIGKHVTAAQRLVNSGLEIIPTGYLLVESGPITSVSYMSNTLPIPKGKADIALATALAGQLLGLKLIYLEAGSGAENPVPPEMVAGVRKSLNIPLIVGGGIDTTQKFDRALTAGADLIVVGNVLEKHPEMLIQFNELRKQPVQKHIQPST
jgi:geranylgeranylglyceryl phosphate synthase family protein